MCVSVCELGILSQLPLESSHEEGKSGKTVFPLKINKIESRLFHIWTNQRIYLVRSCDLPL